MMKRVGMMVSVVWLLLWATAALAEDSSNPGNAKVRVGVYDSRAIALAFVGSEVWKASVGKQLADMRAEYNKAKAEGNQKRMAELQAQGKASQVRLHKQGFSTAPVDDILKHIQDKIPQIAKAANVGPVVSKWDKEAQPWRSPDRASHTRAIPPG